MRLVYTCDKSKQRSDAHTLGARYILLMNPRARVRLVKKSAGVTLDGEGPGGGASHPSDVLRAALHSCPACQAEMFIWVH